MLQGGKDDTAAATTTTKLNVSSSVINSIEPTFVPKLPPCVCVEERSQCPSPALYLYRPYCIPPGQQFPGFPGTHMIMRNRSQPNVYRNGQHYAEMVRCKKLLLPRTYQIQRSVTVLVELDLARDRQVVRFRVRLAHANPRSFPATPGLTFNFNATNFAQRCETGLLLLSPPSPGIVGSAGC